MMLMLSHLVTRFHCLKHSLKYLYCLELLRLVDALSLVDVDVLSESEMLVDVLALDESLCELLKLPDVDVLNESDVLVLLELLSEMLVEPLSESLAPI